MKQKDLNPNGVYHCENCDAFLYGSDACIIKGHVYCLVCAKDALENIYDIKKENQVGVILLFFVPSVLALLCLALLGLASVIPQLNSNAFGLTVGIGYSIAGIWLFVSAIVFGNKHDMMTVIGDPEKLVVETNGEISESGNISLTSHSYQTYSAGQAIDIIGNILKFIIFFFMIGAFGWLYTTIYWVCLSLAKKKYKAVESLFQEKIMSSPEKMSLALCMYGKENQSEKDPYSLEDADTGDAYEVLFDTSFIYKDKIAIVASLASDSHYAVAGYVSPGYVFHMVHDEEFQELMEERNRLLSRN